MNQSHKNKINQQDHARTIITETIPGDTPIFFSNDGLYTQIKNLKTAPELKREIFEKLITRPNETQLKPTIPFSYKITKTALESRRLSLIHPHSQWLICLFYQKYHNLILSHCSKSPITIRSPHKVSSTFYFKNQFEDINQYKRDGISTTDTDTISKYCPTYFSYRKYTRYHHFFDSKEYFELEKQYDHMKTLDVSKCFDSIYTHSMAWATKDKEFTKSNLGKMSTFGDEFDKIMRLCNHNETNGIVVGPEVSRIFAEIIFQKIDTIVIEKLRSLRLELDNHYSIKRYVDDISIFSNSQTTSNQIFKIYSDTLLKFNLHTNPTKSLDITRPFVTERSKIVQEIKNEVNKFTDKFLKKSPDSPGLTPCKIHSEWSLLQSFHNTIKTICANNKTDYSGVSGFLIGVIHKRIRRLVSLNKPIQDTNIHENYCDALTILIKLLYFYYQVAPSVTASYRVSTSIILATRFSETYIPTFLDQISQLIYKLTETAVIDLTSREQHQSDGFLSLEIINLAIASRELGSNYLLHPNTIAKVFQTTNAMTYFEITSCLFYIRDEPIYNDVRTILFREIDQKLCNLDDIKENTEKAYLLLDLLSCPYVDERRRKSYLTRVAKALQIQTTLCSTTNAQETMVDFISNSAHVNWREIDLLNSLEKKALMQLY